MWTSITRTSFLWVSFGYCFWNITCAPTPPQAPPKEMVNYMKKFGYLADAPAGSPDSETLITEEGFATLVKQVQKYGGLPETGKLNDATLKLMDTPRCGVPDILQTRYINNSSSNATVESLLRNKRYTLASKGWRKRKLTYFLSNWPANMDRNEVLQKLENAFKIWSDASPLIFQYQHSMDADLIIGFGRGYHGDSYPFDGRGNTLAHAFFPYQQEPYGGDIHFDDDESWTDESKENSRRNPDGVDFFTVATHEIGHSLGLAHSTTPASIMFPYYKGYDRNFRIGYDDVLGLYDLYVRNAQFEDSNDDSFGSPYDPNNTPNRIPYPTPPSETPRTRSSSADPRTQPDQPTTTSRWSPITTPRPVARVPVIPTTTPRPRAGRPPTIPRPERPPTTLRPRPERPPTTLRPRPERPPTTLRPRPERPPTSPRPRPERIPTSPRSRPERPPTTRRYRPRPRPTSTTEEIYHPTDAPYMPNGDRRRPVVDPHQSIPNGSERDRTKDITNSMPSKPPSVCDGNIDAIAMLRGEIFIFYKEYMWRLSDRGMVKPEYPVPLHSFFTGLPKSVKKIDAIYERKSDYNIIIFSGKQYWSFTGNNFTLDSPRPISDLGISANRVDAAMVWGKNGKTYFFSGDRYWKYDEVRRGVDKDYPMLIKSRWLGLPVSLDSAFTWTDGQTYFFKGSQYWRFNNPAVKVDEHFPRNALQDWLACGM